MAITKVAAPSLFVSTPQMPDWRDTTRIHYPWDALWTIILTGLLAGPPNILALTQWLAAHREVLAQHLGLDRSQRWCAA